MLALRRRGRWRTPAKTVLPVGHYSCVVDTTEGDDAALQNFLDETREMLREWRVEHEVAEVARICAEIGVDFDG